MAKFYIYKGARASEGARNLQAELGATMMRAEGSVYRGRAGSIVINWGTTNREAQRIAGLAPLFLNKPEHVAKVTNKLHFFKQMQELMPDHTIPFCETLEEATEFARVGGRVYARTALNGHSGEGIHLMVNERDFRTAAMQKLVMAQTATVYNIDHREATDLAECKLFTTGIAGKRTEFRIHVVNGKAILRQVKLRKQFEEGQEPVGANTIVRNVASGWVYGVNTVDESVGINEATAAAIQAVAEFGLDFGAVDIVYQESSSKAYVLEINTAPGLADEGSAVEAYTNAFKEYA